MARSLVYASSQYLDRGDSPVTSGVLSMSCWGYSNDAAKRQFVIDLINPGFTDACRLQFSGHVAGDPVGFSTLGGTAQSAETSTGFSAGQWHHAGGSHDGTNAFAYIDGGSKGTSPGGSVTPTGMNRTSVGVNLSGNLYFEGYLAEIGVWNVTLTDAEFAILGLGYSPLFVRPQSLVAYWPFIGRTSPEIDIVNHYNLTLRNAPTTAPHPPIIYPSSYQQGLTIPSADVFQPRPGASIQGGVWMV